MVTFNVREVLSGLEKKGFIRSEGDHTFLIFYVNGKKTSIHTKVSHGSNEINDYLINRMSIQVKLEKKKFIDMVNCPFTLEDYIKELEAQGYCFV
jgi:predicted RNA binding protein YcfA (HicA-like mRNA interferase family)